MIYSELLDGLFKQSFYPL